MRINESPAEKVRLWGLLDLGLNPKGLGSRINYLLKYRNEIEGGDLVVLPTMTVRPTSVGRLTGDYGHLVVSPTQGSGMAVPCRAVSWRLGVSDRRLPDENNRKTVNAHGTVCRVHAPGASEWLLELAT